MDVGQLVGVEEQRALALAHLYPQQTGRLLSDGDTTVSHVLSFPLVLIAPLRPPVDSASGSSGIVVMGEGGLSRASGSRGWRPAWWPVRRGARRARLRGP